MCVVFARCLSCVVRCGLFVVCCLMLVGMWLLVFDTCVDCRSLFEAVCCLLIAVCCLFLFDRCLLFFVRCSLFIDCRLLCVVVVCCLFLFVRCFLFFVRGSFFFDRRLLCVVVFLLDVC